MGKSLTKIQNFIMGVKIYEYSYTHIYFISLILYLAVKLLNIGQDNLMILIPSINLYVSDIPLRIGSPYSDEFKKSL